MTYISTICVRNVLSSMIFEFDFWHLSSVPSLGISWWDGSFSEEIDKQTKTSHFKLSEQHQTVKSQHWHEVVKKLHILSLAMKIKMNLIWKYYPNRTVNTKTTSVFFSEWTQWLQFRCKGYCCHPVDKLVQHTAAEWLWLSAVCMNIFLLAF